MKRLIVGVDPGTTVGIALLSFYNELIFVTSKRNITDDEIEKLILSYGKPVIIATDVPKVPSKVERLATQLGAIVFSPPREIPQREKDRIVRAYGVKVDDHARDALVAAYLAYLHFRPKIEKVIKKIREEEFVEEIIERVLRGEQTAKTVREAFEVKKEEKKRERRRESKEITLLRQKIGQLVREKKRLEERIKRLEERKASPSRGELITLLEGAIQKLRTEKEALLQEIRVQRKTISELERKLRRTEEKLERVVKAVRSGKVVGPPHLVEGEEIDKGIVVGEVKKPPQEKLKDMLEEYRKRRKKELNLL